MSRIRTIKPDFPQSESVGRLSRDARLLFIMLWTVADDDGRCRAASRMLASLLFPYDDDAPSLIDGWLCELEDQKCINRYEVDGSVYIEICNWLKHQKIDHARPSKLPKFREDSRLIRERSRILAPDMDMDRDINLVSTVPSEPSKHSPNGKPVRTRNRYPEDFLSFWASYPTDANMSKAEAAKAWARLPHDDKQLATKSVGAFRAYCAAHPDYRPVHANRYLTQRRFEGHGQTAERSAAVSVVVRQDTPQGKSWDEFTRKTKGKGVPWTNGVWRFPAEWPPQIEAAE